MRSARDTDPTIAYVNDECRGNPGDDSTTHECMKGERRCVWCAVALHPYPCHGCGQFITAEQMHNEVWRCEKCE